MDVAAVLDPPLETVYFYKIPIQRNKMKFRYFTDYGDTFTELRFIGPVDLKSIN